MAKKKYYVVWEGRKPGIYNTWDECKAQVDGYRAARYISFENYEEAKQAFANLPVTKAKIVEVKREKSNTKPIVPSIAVDAACSGNPGVMEYRGVHTDTEIQLFHQKYEEGTNNIGEFLAMVHALALMQKYKSDLPIYSDSRTALSWIKQKQCKTDYEPTSKNLKLFETIKRAEVWLENNTWQNELLKWDTENWGEIPADFGRK